MSEDSHWWNGPPVLYKPIEEWGLKYGIQRNDVLPGEKKIRYSLTTMMSTPLIEYKRYSDVNKIIWIVARTLSIARRKSLKGGNISAISQQLLIEAENLLVKDALKTEVEKTDRSGHRSRGVILAHFRQKCWTAHGSKIAQSANKCQLCKLRNVKFGTQEMGKLPEACLKQAPPFTYTMLDPFGPYAVRGEVQKRTRGKAYGVIFTDLVSRAVHIEAVYGYDKPSFLLALSRFASVSG